METAWLWGYVQTKTVRCAKSAYSDAGSGSALSLILNMEQYEYMRGPQNDAGVKVRVCVCVYTLNTETSKMTP